MPAVQSSNVESFDYDEETQRLLVRFRSGRVYRYADVPSEAVSSLSAALEDADASFGQAFNRIIRSAGYNYEEVSE